MKKKGDVGGNNAATNGQTMLTQSLNNIAAGNLSHMMDVKPKMEPSLHHLQHLQHLSAMGMGQMGLYPHHLPPPPMPPSSMNQSPNAQHQLYSIK